MSKNVKYCEKNVVLYSNVAGLLVWLLNNIDRMLDKFYKCTFGLKLYSVFLARATFISTFFMSLTYVLVTLLCHT